MNLPANLTLSTAETDDGIVPTLKSACGRALAEKGVPLLTLAECEAWAEQVAPKVPRCPHEGADRQETCYAG